MSEVLQSLQRIEDKLGEIARLSERVAKLEIYQSWLKGAWAALAAFYAYLCKTLRCSG